MFFCLPVCLTGDSYGQSGLPVACLCAHPATPQSVWESSLAQGEPPALCVQGPGFDTREGLSKSRPGLAPWLE